jgi:hypothetical protein
LNRRESKCDGTADLSCEDSLRTLWRSIVGDWLNFAVRGALIQAGRGDMIGSGCDCLIAANPPKEAIA